MGGIGSDQFVFNTALNAATNVDNITDFNVAADTMVLENAIFTTIAGTGTLTAAQFVANATGTAQDADDRIVYDTDTGNSFSTATAMRPAGRHCLPSSPPDLPSPTPTSSSFELQQL